MPKGWQRPHSDHRFGNDIDIWTREVMRGVVVNLPLDVKLTLTYLLLARGFRFIEAGARPGDDRKNHFHARLTAVDTPFTPEPSTKHPKRRRRHMQCLPGPGPRHCRSLRAAPWAKASDIVTDFVIAEIHRQMLLHLHWRERGG